MSFHTMSKRLYRRIFRGPRRSVVQTINNDKYLEYLGYTVKGMTCPGNVFAFDHVFRRLASNAPVLEIGSWQGLSLLTMSHLLREHGLDNRIWSCDGWVYEAPGQGGLQMVPGRNATFNDMFELAHHHFIDNVRAFESDRLPHSFRMSADEFFSFWGKGATGTDLFGQQTSGGGKFSFAFVDGDHQEEPAFRDFENADRFLEVGGYLLADDSDAGGPYPGVRRAVHRFLERGTYRVVLENPNLLLQKVA